jgi:hypothetical protein
MPPSFSRPPDGPVLFTKKGIISARKVQEELAPLENDCTRMEALSRFVGFPARKEPDMNGTLAGCAPGPRSA